jgi:hypothetical protein
MKLNYLDLIRQLRSISAGYKVSWGAAESNCPHPLTPSPKLGRRGIGISLAPLAQTWERRAIGGFPAVKSATRERGWGRGRFNAESYYRSSIILLRAGYYMSSMYLVGQWERRAIGEF